MPRYACLALLTALISAPAVAEGITFRVPARVLSVTPLETQVRVEVPGLCESAPQAASGAGAATGAVVGGIVGNRFGGGSGRAALTVVGIVGGAMLGEHLEAASKPPAPTCEPRVYYEGRPDGYEVVYEFAGRQGRMRTAAFPGHDILVEVRVQQVF